ncbi:CCA tRNA nucleotidyltransferase [Rickettsiales endosymbiont of Peranema trichophorum]|uniref:CCA tRNA nucleotidyltransferase n=1 Tax=Rickettsiales endosymbiont of Peranema trichophorum TaxID=2486577 RepID=UPI001A92ED3E|nr:CCA tRNA nucleotidyltransferase [Rickettsiales endosymbiont of Peranema trichophorum]
MLVGGCVRDILANRVAKDIDLATDILPERVQELLRTANIKAFYISQNNRKYGIITTIMNEHTFEISTLRKDVQCFGRQAIIEHTDDWYEDARRRDFTMNALFLNIDGNLYDYFGGVEDINNKIVRFVGEPSERIEEDYLRILRYFRFHSYIGVKTVDPEHLQSIRHYMSLLSSISGERIHQEMLKLLSQQYTKETVILMAEQGLWPHIISEEPNLTKLRQYKFTKATLPNLAAIIRATNKPMDVFQFVANRWRLSNKEHKLLEFLCRQDFLIKPNDVKQNKKLIYSLGRDSFLSLLYLNSIEHADVDISRPLLLLEEFSPPPFPLTGYDLQEIGFNGKMIGVQLKIALNLWMDSDFKLQKKSLLEALVGLQNQNS